MTHRLVLKFDNKSPIELNALTNSLNALAKEYDTFTRSEFGYAKTNRKLEIKKLEQGSIIIELAALAIPKMQEINTILTFGKYLIQGLDHFVGRNKISEPSFSKNSCNNLSNFVDTIANDSDSEISIQIVGNNNTIYVGEDYNSIDCNALQNNIHKYQQSLIEEEPSIIQYKQAFYWFSASFANNPDKNSRNNVDKGIIEKFDTKPHKVIFENDMDKTNITSSNHNFKKDWQELMYIVDVEVVKIQGVIKLYKIIHIHYKDTFDPQDDT
jgi:hypothetical protein